MDAFNTCNEVEHASDDEYADRKLFDEEQGIDLVATFVIAKCFLWFHLTTCSWRAQLPRYHFIFLRCAPPWAMEGLHKLCNVRQ